MATWSYGSGRLRCCARLGATLRAAAEDAQRIVRGEPAHRATGVHGVHDGAVSVQDEGGGLHVWRTVVHARVAPDGTRRGVRVQPVRQGKLQSQLRCELYRVRCGVGGEAQKTCANFVEGGLVLLEVSQLLTTVASPVAAIEEQHAFVPVHLVREPNLALVRDMRLHVRELRADL